MNKTILGTLILALPLAAAAAPENYLIDSPHSIPHFSVDQYAGLTVIYGRFDKMAGKFMIDRAAKTASVEIDIDTTSVSSGYDRRDTDIKGPGFFNVAEFPQMTYRSTGVTFNGDAPAEINGQLTLLGVSKPVALKIVQWTCKDQPFNKRPACGGIATGSLKRTDFGMKNAVPVIGDEIKLTIAFLGYKQ